MTAHSDSPKPLDLLIVISGLGVGGAERHVARIAPALAGRGHRIAVYSLTGDGALRAELESNGIEVSIPSDRGASLPRAVRLILAGVDLIRAMRQMRPRIAHFFLPEAYIVGAIAAWFVRIEFRVMSRRSLNNYQRAYPAALWLEKTLHRTMSAILGNSAAVVRQLYSEEGVPREKLGLIYNGIETPPVIDSRTAMRSSLAADDATLLFVIVANLIPYKGHLDLVKAFGLASARIGQPWRLLVVGRDDGAGPAVRALARELNIDDKLSFLGMRSDVADLLAASDVGMLPSHQEGFSNAILEGMAAGLPMIVTDVGGNAEAVADEVTGLVVPAHAPRLLADAIVRIANDAPLRARYGLAGRERLQSLFLLDACVSKYDALYRGLMAGKKPAAIPEITSGV